VKPVSALDPHEAGQLRGLLFDLDDTVLTRGLLTRTAYDALWILHCAGIKLVAVTGRPTGWGKVIARQWPIAGCVVENGALYVVRDGRGVALRDPCSEGERQARRVRLERLVEQVGTIVPEARLTDDVEERRSDVTWDIGERVKLPDDRVRAIAGAIAASGARATASSVHLHATFDADDKASGALRFCAHELGEDPGSAIARFAFVGDSGNDAACFAAFRTTFGVANVRASVDRLSIPPRYVASRAMGDGFAEIAAEIVSKRSAHPPPE
jgi:hydroxymethylpyrimidine pyrophosphatase-like HAD family hydrolase